MWIRLEMFSVVFSGYFLIVFACIKIYFLNFWSFFFVHLKKASWMQYCYYNIIIPNIACIFLALFQSILLNKILFFLYLDNYYSYQRFADYYPRKIKSNNNIGKTFYAQIKKQILRFLKTNNYKQNTSTNCIKQLVIC